MKSKKSDIIIGNLKKFLKPVVHVCDKWRKKIVPQVVCGILKAKNVILAEIGRKVKRKDQKIKTIENILSRHLNSKSWNEEELEEAYLRDKCKDIREDTLIIIDSSERIKPYGEKMEDLSYVRDGSKKEIKPGYWTFEAISLNGDEMKYLFSELFAVDHEGCPSFPGKIQNNVEKIIKYSEGRGIYLYDRGYDSNDTFKLHQEREKPVKCLVRVIGNREILDLEGKSLGIVEDYAKKFHMRGCLTAIKNKAGRKKQIYVDFDFLKVKLPNVEGEFALVISKFNEEYTYLLTNIEVENLRDAEKIIRHYAKRWDVEDVIRLIKQETLVEKFLVRGYKAIKRLNFFAFLACAFILEQSNLSDSFLKWIQDFAECFKKDVEFIYYRLFDGIRKFFNEMRGSSFHRMIHSFQYFL